MMKMYVEKESMHVIGEERKQRLSLKRAEKLTFKGRWAHLKLILNCIGS